jgi:hypothetical protein
MKRYRAPWVMILEYFSGIRPPEYYELKAEWDKAEKQLDDFRKEQSVLERARVRFSRAKSLSGPKLEPKNFELEIGRLTTEVTELNKRQEKLRETAVREQETITSVVLQLGLANKALRTYDYDANFLSNQSDEKLICPTCGAEHLDPFMDLLSYAEDARVLRDLVLRLDDDLKAIQAKHKKTRQELFDLESNYKQVADVLNTRRGDLQFRQVVESMGAESAFMAFEEENEKLQQDINRSFNQCD